MSWAYWPADVIRLNTIDDGLGEGQYLNTDRVRRCKHECRARQKFSAEWCGLFHVACHKQNGIDGERRDNYLIRGQYEKAL